MKKTDEQISVNEEAMEKEYDPWQETRQVYVPKMNRGEQDTLEVGVNDKTYFVPKDKWVDVPGPVADVVEEMLYRRKLMEENAKKASGVHEVAV